MNGVLILAHGSRAQKTIDTMEAVASMTRAKLGDTLVEIAYMEFAEPNIAGGLDKLAAKGVKNVKVVPYFLFEGIHIKEDIPTEIAAYLEKNPTLNISLGKTLGADPRLADILADRILG